MREHRTAEQWPRVTRASTRIAKVVHTSRCHSSMMYSPTATAIGMPLLRADLLALSALRQRAPSPLSRRRGDMAACPNPHRSHAAALGHDRDAVLDRDDARRRPRHPLCLLPFGPGADGAFQCDLLALHLHRDPLGVGLRTAHQGVFDLPLQLLGRGLDPRAHRNEVGDPPQTWPKQTLLVKSKPHGKAAVYPTFEGQRNRLYAPDELTLM